MKTKHLLVLPVMLMLTALAGTAQDADYDHHSVKHIPFGKKLPPPDLTTHANAVLSPVLSNIDNANGTRKSPDDFRQLLLDRRKAQASLFQNTPAGAKSEGKIATASNNSAYNFHLVKDINALSESNPHNSTNFYYDINNNFISSDSLSFAILNDVIYFVADDGTQGNELWRSDGTASGTFLLKDIEPGDASSNIFNITALNGKIYFSAYYGSQLWVSDGTGTGTQALNISNPGEFFSVGNKTYFIADGIGYLSAVWTTDGTIGGTTQVVDVGSGGFSGEQVSQVTLVDGLLFFTFLDYETFGWQIWRSDLTDAGTYHVGPTYDYFDPVTYELTNFIPAQLTNYKNKLYFSADDGTGRKLWVSDGTDAGTTLAPGNNNVLIDADLLRISFPIVNNILYAVGDKTNSGNGLYKYDPANGAGLVKIKDFVTVGGAAFVVNRQMQVVNNNLYFKVSSSTGGVHDELWSSKGTTASTRLVYKLLPGETLNNLYNANGSLYFVKDDRFFGSELWRVFETYFGSFPIITNDIFKGRPGSHPSHLTAFKERLIFSAADEQKGNELFITHKFGFGATLVKDINTVTTSTSLTGYNPYNYLGYAGMIALGDEVLFTAYERVHGKELYKSDGTAAGTELLNDIVPGDAGFDALIFLQKNKAVYFIAISKNGYSIYKTKGTKNSLSKITPDYRTMITFSVADNGLVFYEVYNYNTALYELWRTDGTTTGTYLLSSTLYTAYSSYLNVVGNTAFFVAGDTEHGYELWKSDGSVAGTKIVKDINPGVNNSVPGGMFIYKNEVYFSAEDGTSPYPSFWKSNGTNNGTIKLADIDPFWGRTVAATLPFFGVSKNILYFTAINRNDLNGTQLWKTDGTIAGTQVVKDINPTDGSPSRGPINLTDVNGTLFFTANDGVNGNELWKTNGTEESTQLVKDISTGSASTSFYKFASFDGKIFFTAVVNGNQRIWYSDGTANGTHEVLDPDISDVIMIDIYAAGKHLFFPGYSSKLGLELYAGKADEQTGQFMISKTTDIIEETARSFNAVLYPNPTVSNVTLQLTGDVKNVSISIADINGKKLWQANNSNATLIHLPTEKYVAGIYIVTIKSDTENRTIRVVKK